MLSETLIRELQKLSRADKVRAMQVLVADLAVEEEALLKAGMTFELVTPYGNEAAAQVLAGHLAASSREDE